MGACVSYVVAGRSAPGPRPPLRGAPCSRIAVETPHLSSQYVQPCTARACVSESSTKRFPGCAEMSISPSRATASPCSSTGASGTAAPFMRRGRQLIVSGGVQSSTGTLRAMRARTQHSRPPGGQYSAFGNTALLRKSLVQSATPSAPRRGNDRRLPPSECPPG